MKNVTKHSYLPILGFALSLLISGCTDWSVNHQAHVAVYPTCPTCTVHLPPQAEIRSNLMSTALLELATDDSVTDVAQFFELNLLKAGWEVKEISAYFASVDYRLEKEQTKFILHIGRENEGMPQQKTIITIYPCKTQQGPMLNCLE